MSDGNDPRPSDPNAASSDPVPSSPQPVAAQVPAPVPSSPEPVAKRAEIEAAVAAAARPRVTDVQLHAFLQNRDIHGRIWKVVHAGCNKSTPPDVREDIFQTCLETILTTESRCETPDALQPWCVGVSFKVVAEWFRQDKKRTRYLNPDADLDEAAEKASIADLGSAGSTDIQSDLLGPWLKKAVEGSARDLVLYELLVYKAKSKKSYEQIAEETRESPEALKQRVKRFKAKYEPLRQKHLRRQNLLLWIFLGALVLAAILAWLVARGRIVSGAVPDFDGHPAVTASPRHPPPRTFNNAQPTQPPDQPQPSDGKTSNDGKK